MNKLNEISEEKVKEVQMNQQNQNTKKEPIVIKKEKAIAVLIIVLLITTIYAIKRINVINEKTQINKSEYSVEQSREVEIENTLNDEIIKEEMLNEIVATNEIEEQVEAAEEVNNNVEINATTNKTTTKQTTNTQSQNSTPVKETTPTPVVETPVVETPVAETPAPEPVKQKNKYTLYEFKGSWCGSCVSMEPIVNKYRYSYDNITVKIMDLDDKSSWDLADAYHVSSIPAFIMVDSNGNVVENRVGYMKDASFKSFLEKYYE